MHYLKFKKFLSFWNRSYPKCLHPRPPMFESITITGHHYNIKKQLDMGSLVEAMLLYGKVTVVVNFDILVQIFQYFGDDNVFRLLSEKYLDIVYLESFLGIMKYKETYKEFHRVTQFSSPQHQFQDKLNEICIGAKGKTGAGRRLALRLGKYFRVSRDTAFVLEGAKDAILNPRYLKSSAQIVIQELVPNLISSKYQEFKAYETDKGFIIETDLLDRLTAGWKPNLYIEGDVQSLLTNVP